MNTDAHGHADYVRPSDVRIAELETENARLRERCRHDWNLLVKVGNDMERLREAVLRHEWWKDCDECSDALQFDGSSDG